MKRFCLMVLVVLVGLVGLVGCATTPEPPIKSGLLPPIISDFKFQPDKIKWGGETSYSFSYRGANGGVKEIILEGEVFLRPGRIVAGEPQRRAAWVRKRSIWTPTPEDVAPHANSTEGRFEKTGLKEFPAPKEGWEDTMTYTYYLWIVDREGLKSNVLTTELTVSSRR